MFADLRIFRFIRVQVIMNLEDRKPNTLFIVYHQLKLLYHLKKFYPKYLLYFYSQLLDSNDKKNQESVKYTDIFVYDVT